MQITKHVYFYPSAGESLARPSNTVVVIGKDKQIMIDPGFNFQNRLNNLIADMEKDNLDINKTEEMWLTHFHPDHSWMIQDLSERFKEQRIVRCHQMGKSILSNPKLKKAFIFQEAKRAFKYWSLKDIKKISPSTRRITLGIAKKEILDLLKKITITNLEPFLDEEIVDIYPIKVQIIFLPGHTPDEIGFWIPREKVLILGDLVNIFQPEDKKMVYKLVLNTSYSDIGEALKSFQRMKQIKGKIKRFFGFSSREAMPEILLTAHSAPVFGKKRIQEIFDLLISKIENYEVIAKKFITEKPNLKGTRLVKEFAKVLSDDNLLETEKRFTAEGTLKSLKVIK